jgi:hypothetical protein
VALSPNGHWLAALDRTQVVLIDPQSGEIVSRAPHASGSFAGIVFTPDGRLISGGGADKSVRLWNVVTGECTATIKAKGPVYAVAAAPDGNASAKPRNIIKQHVGAEPRLNGGKRGSSVREQNPDHAPQGFGGAPQQLVAYGERAEVLVAHRELAQPADRHFQRSGHGGRRQPPDAVGAGVGDDTHPLVAGSEHRLDLGERDVARELDGQRLAVAAHGANAHAQAIHRNGVLLHHAILPAINARAQPFGTARRCGIDSSQYLRSLPACVKDPFYFGGRVVLPIACAAVTLTGC